MRKIKEISYTTSEMLQKAISMAINNHDTDAEEVYNLNVALTILENDNEWDINEINSTTWDLCDKKTGEAFCLINNFIIKHVECDQCLECSKWFCFGDYRFKILNDDGMCLFCQLDLE